MASVICKKCEGAISNDPIPCFGLCEHYYHDKCIGLSTPLLRDFKKSQNLFWACADCAQRLRAVDTLRFSHGLSRDAAYLLESLQSDFRDTSRSVQATSAGLRLELSSSLDCFRNEIALMKQESASSIRSVKDFIDSLTASHSMERNYSQAPLLTTLDEVKHGIKELDLMHRELLTSFNSLMNKLNSHLATHTTTSSAHHSAIPATHSTTTNPVAASKLTHQAVGENPSKRRLMDRSPDSSPTNTVTRAMLSSGTGLSCNNITTVPERPPRTWVFISRIAPDTPIEAIREMACSNIGTDDILVYSLVRRDRDLSTLSYVSFKIGVPDSHRAIALAASTWPRGISFKEFIDLNPRSVNVWRPTTAASLAPSAPINRESDHPSSPPSINHTTQLRNADFTISPDHGPMSLPYTQYFQQA